MRKARLPETDLARVALLPEDQQLRLLRNMKRGFSPFSYAPTKAHLHDTANIRVGGLEVMPADMSREQLLRLIARASASDVEASANCEVSGLLYDWVRDGGVNVFSEDFGRLSLAPSYSVCFWMNAIFQYRGRPLAINPDFRRSSGYSPAARRFAFSAMHQRIRMLGGDFADVELAIMRFPGQPKAPRGLKLITAAGVDLLPYDLLAEKTQATLRLWDQVCDERHAEARSAAANDSLPLFAFGSGR